MSGRDASIRAWMRAYWGGRTRQYAAKSAPRNQQYADELLRRVRIEPGDRILDVACGSGVVAFAAAALAGPTGSVVATDLAPEWGAVVNEQTPLHDGGPVRFAAMGMEALALADASFDVVVCEFGLMFAPNPATALGEMRRVLRDGGRLGLAVWSTADKVLHRLVQTRIDELLADAAPESDLRLPTPTSLGEPGMIEQLVAAAGFERIAVGRRTFDIPMDDPDAEWRLRFDTNAQPDAIPLSLDPVVIERQRQRTMAEIERYRRDGTIQLPSEAIFVTAMR